jgi:hypothetical protein
MNTTSLCLSAALALSLATVSAAAAPERHPAYEPKEAGAGAAAGSAQAENLFLNAKVTASGHWNNQKPELAVDGRSDNPENHWACENLPVWLTVDMGAAKSLSAVRIWPYWSDGRVYKYKVEGSADGQRWELLADQTANSICGSPEGSLFTFPPKNLRYVRTTVTGNSKGDASGGHIVEIAGYAASPKAGLEGGIGSVDQRYAPNERPQVAAPTTGIRLTAWRGERVNAQVAVWATAAQEQLRVDSAVLTGRGASIPVQTNFVRCVLANGKPQADILDTETMLSQPAGAVRPVWISVDVPRTAAPGLYSGKVVVRSELGAVEFPVSLEVLAAALPAPKDWKFHLDLWQHPQAVARWHDVRPWSPEHFALMKPLMQRLADAGQKTITCPIIHEAWGGQTYDWFPSMIEWRKKADGSWTYDYSIFDRWVSFMSDDVGMKNARIHCYTMIPWSLKFRYYDEAKRAYVDAALRPGTPEYDEFWGRFLRDFTKHLKAKGWLERTRIGMDERPDALMRGAIATLARHAPGLKIASAINAPSAMSNEVDDVSPVITHASGFSPADLEARRKAGKRTTFYVCCGPDRPNTFTFSPPAESTWLGIFAAARGYDGFLRWAYNSWVANPLQSTDFTSWPSGDCFLVYPGNRSSVRFERLRDGIEEAEKIRLLREAAAASASPAAKAAMEKLEAVLADFTWARGQKPGVHADDVARAAEAVTAAARAIGPLPADR